MIPATSLKLAGAAVLAAGLFAASAALAESNGVTPLSVTGGHPTSVTVSIKGKDIRAVRNDVGRAAYFVCRNFVGLDGISLDEVDGCADHAFGKAMRAYTAIAARHTLADNGVIVLSAR
jgi:hypothetical protein